MLTMLPLLPADHVHLGELGYAIQSSGPLTQVDFVFETGAVAAGALVFAPALLLVDRGLTFKRRSCVQMSIICGHIHTDD